jgi:hypothetical protein
MLGDQISIADIHLSAWLARLVKLSGGSSSDDGNSAIAKLEAHIGGGFKLPRDSHFQQNSLAAFWDAMKVRRSWKEVYANGLQ